MSRVLRGRSGARPSRAAASSIAPTHSGAGGSHVQCHCESGKWLCPQPESLLPHPTGISWEQMCQERQCRGSCCPCSVSAATWPVPELAHPIPQAHIPPIARTGPGGQHRNGTRLKVVPSLRNLRLFTPLHHQHGHALSHGVQGFSPSDYC